MDALCSIGIGEYGRWRRCFAMDDQSAAESGPIVGSARLDGNKHNEIRCMFYIYSVRMLRVQ